MPSVTWLNDSIRVECITRRHALRFLLTINPNPLVARARPWLAVGPEWLGEKPVIGDIAAGVFYHVRT